MTTPDLSTEEARAAAYRLSQVTGAQARRARLLALRGNSAARLALGLAWQPVWLRGWGWDPPVLNEDH